MINRSFRSLFGKLVIGGALGLASVAASSQLALGEELSTPASVPSPTADHPTRGMTMEKVQAKFGDWGRVLLAINPLVSVIEGFRWAICGTADFHWLSFAISGALGLLLLAVGIRFFRSTERTFADVI